MSGREQVTERDGSLAAGVLATKLHVPRPQPGFVPRSRLTARLDEGLAGRLMLLCAPAGFGKTALLAAWASGGHRPVAWLSLDEGDNDPARFWRHVAAALEAARPGISGSIGPLLGPPPPRSFEPVVTALINELAADPAAEPVLLVLDDYHLVGSEPVHAALRFLLEHLPPALRLVLSTRSDPPLRLGRLRARGELAEVRAADLRFTADEAALLLRRAARLAGSSGPADGATSGPEPALTEAMIGTLTARTEGWAAGLHLAALSLQGQQDAGTFVAEFGGSHRYVLDYLAEEVLDRQDPALRQFLLETSVLDRLSGELCDAVTGRSGGQQMLEHIERAGLFLVPLDEVRSWWRYHHLFADLLRARLEAEQPGRAASLHRAAAAWHDQHGLADDAIRHAVAAGEPDRAAELIERHFDAVYFTGENATVTRWLSAVPADIARARPRLSLAQAFVALTGGDMAAAQEAIGAIGEEPAAPAGSPQPPGTAGAAGSSRPPGKAGPVGSSRPTGTAGPADSFRPSVGAAASLIVNAGAAALIARAWLAYLHGDAGQMMAFASQARDRLRDGEHMLRSIYELNLALAHWLSGRLAEAEQVFTEAVAWWREAGQHALAAQGCNYLGQIRLARGHLDGALDAYRELLQIAAPTGRMRSPVAGIGHVGIAEVCYQRGDLAAARQELAKGLPLCRRLSETQALATGLATLAQIRQAEGDPAGAREAMAEAVEAGPSAAVAGMLNPVPALGARLQLAQGDAAAAARWSAQKGLSPSDDLGYPRERDYLVLARVLLAQDQPRPAVGLLDRLLSTAQAQDRSGSVIEIRTLRALALGRAGDRTGAQEELAAALALAAPHGHIRVFADEGPSMAALLSQVLAAQRDRETAAAQVPPAYLTAVLRACGRTGPAPQGRSAPATVPGLIEPLTSREMQVLELLAAGSPNQRIAETLVVTLDTVKKHVTHLLGKLGAANRTEAVTRARQLGLIG